MPAPERRHRPPPAVLPALATIAVLPGLLGAQSSGSVRVGAHGVAAYQWADPIPGGGSLGEVRLVQPTLFLRAGAGEPFRLVAVLNLEGATIPGGELTPGDWGEGFVDRRHPHTYLHEIMVSADDLLGPVDGTGRASLSVGKGFAPFGTDDPMMRPFLRYPVNHHLAQVLERAVAIGAVRRGRATAEFGVFNGDEPERPTQLPRIGGRFGDSWAGRFTVAPGAGIELQGSRAHVHSPEHRRGAGTDQDKWSLSGRWSRPIGPVPVYALVEWARTSEAGGFFVFQSILAEGRWARARHRLQYRFERTERPEEERLSNFRSLRPHLENSILGTTRWTIHTVGYEWQGFASSLAQARPVAEISYGTIRKVGAGFFDVATLYGRSHFWSLAIGVRLGVGAPMHRMGRYGAAAAGGRDGQPMEQH